MPIQLRQTGDLISRRAYPAKLGLRDELRSENAIVLIEVVNSMVLYESSELGRVE